MEQLVRQSETGDAALDAVVERQQYAETMAACKTHALKCSWEEKGNVQLDAIIEVALEEAAKQRLVAEVAHREVQRLEERLADLAAEAAEALLEEEDGASREGGQAQEALTALATSCARQY